MRDFHKIWIWWGKEKESKPSSHSLLQTGRAERQKIVSGERAQASVYLIHITVNAILGGLKITNSKKEPKFIFLYLLFFASGISGLVYQVIWARMFGLVFGNTIFASSTVLAAFMAGLALGSFIAGRYVSSRSDGLKIYAILEFVIGIFGCIIAALLSSLPYSYIWIYQTFNPSFTTLTVVRFVLSFILLLIPCTFMGATLPVLGQYITTNKKSINSIIGKLYGVNTLGAVVGCFSSGFILIGLMGLFRTSLIAAFVNIAVGSIAYYMSRKNKAKVNFEAVPPKTILETQRSDMAAFPSLYGWLLLIACLLSGFSALGMEVAWIRALVWVLGVDSYAFASMLSVLLAGIGIGSLIFSLIKGKYKEDIKFLVILQFLIGIFIVLSINIMHHSVHIKTEVGDFISNSNLLTILSNVIGAYTIVQITITSFILFIPSLLMGISFPLFVNVYIKINGSVGRGIGNLYSANTMGAILGSLCMGFFMIPVLGLFPSIILMGGIYFSISFALIIGNAREVLKTRLIRVIVLLFFAIIITSQTDTDVTHFIEKTLESDESGTKEELMYFKEHATGAVLIKKSKYRGREMLIDGIQVASTGDFDLHSHLFPSHLMGLLKKDIEDVLIVAFGCGGTSGSMLLYDEIKAMDVVEICQGVKEPASIYFADMNRNVFDDPRLNLIIQDGKNYMKMTERKYDVIYSGPIHPQSNQSSAGLYTLDYFKDCRERLKEDGLQCLWLPIHMSSPKYFKIVVKSFLEVYPHVTLWMLPQTMSSVSHPHLIGSKTPIYPDYNLISDRLNRPEILKDIARLNNTSFKKPSEFIALLAMDERNLKILVNGIETLNTDDRPVVEFYKRSNNLLLESKRTKALLIEEIRKLMVNPYELVRNIPDEKKPELEQELDRFFKGYKYLLMGHCLLIYSKYFNFDFDSDSKAKIARSLEGAYRRAFDLIPGNLYLKNYFND